VSRFSVGEAGVLERVSFDVKFHQSSSQNENKASEIHKVHRPEIREPFLAAPNPFELPSGKPEGLHR
jgi:hypothetical protein